MFSTSMRTDHDIGSTNRRRDHQTNEKCHLQTKQEAGKSSSTMEPPKLMKSSSSSSRLWLGLKDPRIVRVSRTFGGKDRHSKVKTIKGLRDRRVRLSVSTAIQLYDLQEKLGLTQPSKVVDWLLNVAQHEIDKLPPLQFPQGVNWNLDFPQPTLPFPHEIDTTSDQPRNGFDEDQQHTWNLAQFMGFKRIDDGLRHQDHIPNNGTYMGSYFHLDPSHSGILNLGGSNSSAAASLSLLHDQTHQYGRSSLSLVPSSQLMLCPSGTMLSTFQSYGSVASTGSDHLNNTTGHHHYQFATSSSSPPVIPTMIFPGETLHRESSSFLNISTQK